MYKTELAKLLWELNESVSIVILEKFNQQISIE